VKKSPVAVPLPHSASKSAVGLAATTVTFPVPNSFIVCRQQIGVAWPFEPESQLNAVSETTERRLIEAAQQDPARFGELYELHFDRVYAYISRRLGDRDAAQDITSEVFHHALANLKHFEWRGAPFGAWLMRIASNAITDRWRRQNRESGRASEIEAVSKDPSPEEVQHRARLFAMVRSLPEDQRRVIEMRFAEEKSVREIALALGKTEGSIKQLQFRGIQKLRDEVGSGARAKTSDANA
jgi:RNA polymerase sigma-70 factor (ECF subfamily)